MFHENEKYWEVRLLMYSSKSVYVFFLLCIIIWTDFFEEDTKACIVCRKIYKNFSCKFPKA